MASHPRTRYVHCHNREQLSNHVRLFLKNVKYTFVIPLIRKALEVVSKVALEYKQ